MNAQLMTQSRCGRARPADFNLRLVFSLTLGLLAAASLCRAGQTITTSGGTFGLTDPSELVDASAVKGAERTAELAASAAASDVKKAEGEVAAAQTAIDAHNEAVKAQAQETNQHNAAVKEYDSKVSAHDSEVNRYTGEVDAHNSRVAASNALAPENRDEGTVNALNAEKGQLDEWQGRLENDKAALDTEMNRLNEEKASLDRRAQELDDESKQLNADMDAKKAKLGEAYRQLQACYNYAQQVRALMAKYNVPPPAANDDPMSDYAKSLERMKELSGKGFDGNTDKRELTPDDVKN